MVGLSLSAALASPAMPASIKLLRKLCLLRLAAGQIGKLLHERERNITIIRTTATRTVLGGPFVVWFVMARALEQLRWAKHAEAAALSSNYVPGPVRQLVVHIERDLPS